MNRTIRSIILTGVIMLWILLFNTQPVQAGKSPTVYRVGYTGPISLVAEFNLNTTAAEVMGLWSIKGTVFIKDVDFDDAWIEFDSWTISLSEVQNNGVAWGWVGANAKSDAAYSNSFDAKEPSVTIPFGIKNITYGNPKCYVITGLSPCSLWAPLKGMINKFSAMLTTIKLEAYFKDDKKMGGSCSLPGWDDRNSAYSETCKWAAFSNNVHQFSWTSIGSGKK
jgi:hypothetical protein